MDKVQKHNSFVCKLVLQFSISPVPRNNLLSWWSNVQMTDSMEQSPPWEAHSHSASQEIPPTFMEPEDSLPCSQQPTTGHCPKPDAFSLHLPTHYPKIYSNIIFHLRLGLHVVSSLLVFRLQFLCISNFSHACYTSRPSHSPWLNHPNNMCCSVQFMKLLVMQTSPSSSHFFPLRSKYYPRHPVPNGLNLYSSLNVETKFHIHTKQQVKLQFRFLETRREDNVFWTKCWQAFPEFRCANTLEWPLIWILIPQRESTQRVFL
jgi:hypothetical protein